MFGRALMTITTASARCARDLRDFLIFVIVSPVLAVLAFAFDGVYIGATLGARHAQPDGGLAERSSSAPGSRCVVRHYDYGARY